MCAFETFLKLLDINNANEIGTSLQVKVERKSKSDGDEKDLKEG